MAGAGNIVAARKGILPAAPLLEDVYKRQGLGSRGNVRVRQNPLTGQIQFETEEREPDEVTPRRSMARPLKIGFGFIGILIALMVVALSLIHILQTVLQ